MNIPAILLSILSLSLFILAIIKKRRAHDALLLGNIQANQFNTEDSEAARFGAAFFGLIAIYLFFKFGLT